MPKQPANQYMKGALILTVAAFIVKVLSAVYRVPYQNIVGDIGFYIYQQVYPIYGVGMILATSGFPVIISKLAAEDGTGKREYLAHRMQAAFITLLLVGMGLFSFFFFGANFLSTLMGDEQLTPLIQMSAFLFLLLPFFSIGRGYFQSLGEMTPTAASQVTEQTVRVLIIIMAAIVLTNRGHSLYHVGTGAIAGSIIGGVVGVGILIVYILKRKVYTLFFIKGLSWKKFYKTAQIVLVHGAIFCLSSMLLILFQFVDSFTIYTLLTDSGVEVEKAKALKGIFDRGQPLIQLGTVVASSFSLTLVPIVTAAWMKDNETAIQMRTIQAIKITTVIATGATIGLINIIRPTNIMLFANDRGSSVLSVLALSILFTSFILICIGILQALGHVFVIGKYLFIGLGIKIIGNYIGIPILGTMGAALSTVIGLVVMAVLLIGCLHKRVAILQTIKTMTPSICFAAIGMTLILQLWFYLFSFLEINRLTSLVRSLSGVALGAGAYLWIILKRGLLTEEELSFFPFGNKLNRLNSKRK
ncbi:polysaccharide biosynthesis protein [Lederbergia sp. NSJ-179]|uniref:putative polysaccharide biosynthesis protein n=1 Tax=Lederbergia sp. NSJ-179 TaxID=2931402 RepID=UPI001FD14CD0|nr:polysaccharide biosynthesis protein [Lederbergia sp. NSJ-179]MCJ7843033.1 polysaccharide biosynthesis protein [Lederbergia sp. NSJ-179]